MISSLLRAVVNVGGNAMERSEAADFDHLWGKVITKAWHDEAFKKRLLETPEAVLAEEGLDPPPGVKFRVVEETPEQVYLTLPAKIEGELKEEDLECVVGGTRTIGGGVWGGSILLRSRMSEIMRRSVLSRNLNTQFRR
jgi:hypothetical protein